MIKYTKQEQRFISKYYNYDLERFREAVDALYFDSDEYDEYRVIFNKIFGYSQELINENTKNAQSLFKMAEDVEEKLRATWESLCEKYDSGTITEPEITDQGNIWDILESLRILNNLHPDRILTWEDVANGYS